MSADIFSHFYPRHAGHLIVAKLSTDCHICMASNGASDMTNPMRQISVRSFALLGLTSLAVACGPRQEAMDVFQPDTFVPGTDGTATDIPSATIDNPNPTVDNPNPTGDQPNPTVDNPIADTGVINCPANPPVEMVAPGDIMMSQTWDCNRIYSLSGLTFVRAGATITIRPGTQILSRGMGAALIITRGARIDAQGTRERPIVFSSSNAVGMRRQGDWAGVVLLGAAPINVTGAGVGMGTNNIEGIEASDARGNYGGADAEHNCGTMRWVRIEFAGQGLSMGNELNGLTTGGCGRGTTLDYIQVHQAADDAFEFFGGTHDAKHLVATQQDDDGLDWDFGYNGRIQFMVIQSPATSGESDPRGIEADNNRNNNDALPRSSPTISNISVIGAEGAEPYTQPAIVLRRGTAGAIHNAIVMEYKQGAADVVDNSTVAQARAMPVGLFIRNSIFFNNGMNGMTHFTDLSAAAAEGMPPLDEDMFFRDAQWANRFDVNPMIMGATNPTMPNFAPAAGSAAAMGAGTPPAGGFFDQTATFVGAVRPGAAGPENWTTGWTSYPAN